MGRVSTATGLTFIADGATSESPSNRREPYQPARYGDRWAPVLIAWVTPAENPDFAADVTGEGGSTPNSRNGGPGVYVTGQVELDSRQFTRILRRPTGNETALAVILHELGHVVGLGHVTDSSQLMYPETRPGITNFGAGDLTGLAALGRGRCVPSL
jgi:hypothetical protein